MGHGIITISRQYGSGGRLIGAKLAEKLQIPFYGKEIIELAAQQSGVSGSFFAQPEQAGSYFLRDFSAGVPTELPLGDKVYLTQYAALCALAKKGSCVIVGHGAGAALKNVMSVLNVFIYADLDTRKRRAIEEYGENPHKIEEHMAVIDKKRASYFKFYAGIDGRKTENYHLCIDSGRIGIEGAVAVIEAAYGSKA
ncbi:MAG: cytidylate kinase-like family protein [Ruthenibacterium sp.]